MRGRKGQIFLMAAMVIVLTLFVVTTILSILTTSRVRYSSSRIEYVGMNIVQESRYAVAQLLGSYARCVRAGMKPENYSIMLQEWVRQAQEHCRRAGFVLTLVPFDYEFETSWNATHAESGVGSVNYSNATVWFNMTLRSDMEELIHNFRATYGVFMRLDDYSFDGDDLNVTFTLWRDDGSYIAGAKPYAVICAGQDFVDDVTAFVDYGNGTYWMRVEAALGGKVLIDIEEPSHVIVRTEIDLPERLIIDITLYRDPGYTQEYSYGDCPYQPGSTVYYIVKVSTSTGPAANRQVTVTVTDANGATYDGFPRTDYTDANGEIRDSFDVNYDYQTSDVAPGDWTITAQEVSTGQSASKTFETAYLQYVIIEFYDPSTGTWTRDPSACTFYDHDTKKGEPEEEATRGDSMQFRLVLLDQRRCNYTGTVYVDVTVDDDQGSESNDPDPAIAEYSDSLTPAHPIQGAYAGPLISGSQSLDIIYDDKHTVTIWIFKYTDYEADPGTWTFDASVTYLSGSTVTNSTYFETECPECPDPLVASSPSPILCFPWFLEGLLVTFVCLARLRDFVTSLGKWPKIP